MRSRTSCFNKTLYGKTLRRFWPVWFGGALLWFLFEPLYLFNWGTNPGSTVMTLRYHLTTILCSETHILWFLFSVPVAMAVFSWLYNSRSVGFTAALPLTRNSLFVSCYLAGLTILLSTALFTGGIMALVNGLKSGGSGDLIALWLLISVLDILNFYGFACLCAMLTGNLVVMPLCTLVLQFTAVVVEALIRELMNFTLFGYSSNLDSLAPLSPLWSLCQRCKMVTEYNETGTAVLNYSFSGLHTVIVYGLCGLVFTLLAWALFRQRRMETAGDTVAIALLKPVFRWCMGIGCGLVTAVGIYDIILDGRYVPCTGGYFLLLLALLVLGGLMGWFAADMLINKSFKVFRLHPKGAVLLCGILLSLGLSLGFDVAGIEQTIPERSSFDSVEINCNGEVAVLAEEESIEQVLRLHASIIENKSLHESEAQEYSRYIRLVYVNGDGTVLERTYRLAATKDQARNRNSDLRFAERVLNLTEAIRWRKSTEVPVTEQSIAVASIDQWEYIDSGKAIYEDYPLASTVDSDRGNSSELYFGGCAGYSEGAWRLTPKEAYELYTECILPDLLEGTLGRIWLVSDEEYAKSIYNIQFHMEIGNREYQGYNTCEWFYTVPTVHSWRTNAWLEAHGVVLETYWDYLNRLDRTDVLE